MYIPANNTSSAYDLATFDVEEIAAKRKSRPEFVQVNTAAARSGNWFFLLLVIFCVVAFAAILLSSKVRLNEIAAESNIAAVQLEEANKERARLQTRLDGMVTPALVEEYAQNELGLRKTQTTQVNHVSVNVERVIEVTEIPDEDVFTRINNWFDGVLEYLGFD